MNIEITEEWAHPRSAIQKLVGEGDIQTLLRNAGALHGHYCPGLALGVKAACTALKRLGLDDNTGMEEIMSITECNNCFVDGLQYVSGCTLGNNALIYMDMGKTAATFYRRGDKKGVRLRARTFDLPGEPEDEKKEGDALFEKAVKKRQPLSGAEKARMKELWIKRSIRTVMVPETDLFDIKDVDIPKIEFAPIVNSRICTVCGENAMETKMSEKNGEWFCRLCDGEDYYLVAGKGIDRSGGRP